MSMGAGFLGEWLFLSDGRVLGGGGEAGLFPMTSLPGKVKSQRGRKGREVYFRGVTNGPSRSTSQAQDHMPDNDAPKVDILLSHPASGVMDAAWH